jgi:uncharacterized protein YprB with RNaseH-like and TPR domain
MIQSSFCFLAGVGSGTERRLWRAGVTTWSQFVATPSIRGIGRARKALYDTAISRAQEHYADHDARYFGVALRQRDHWRLYEWLRSKAVFLDIETDSFGRITVVGLYGQGRFTSLMRGESLDHRRLATELSLYDFLVTFCGTTFDLPMLLAQYPGLPLDQPHMDLCFVGKQLGYCGGLKAIEIQMGIARASGLEGLNGRDAVHLWNRWRYSRDAESRERLMAYNQADCVNLERLADAFYARMAESIMRDIRSPLAAPQGSS